MATTKPIGSDLFVSRPEPALVGGRHRDSGRVVFPLPEGVEREDYDRVMLPTRGFLWSFTIQRFPPKRPPYAGPEPFEAYAIGYVELPDSVIVEARLIDVDFASLRIGMAMTLRLVPFATNMDGEVREIFAFAPLQENGS